MLAFLKDFGRRLLGLEQQPISVEQKCEKVIRCCCDGEDDEEVGEHVGKHFFIRSVKDEEEQQRLLRELADNPYLDQLKPRCLSASSSDTDKKFYYHVEGYASGHLRSPILKYSARQITKPSKPGCWDVATIEVLKDGELIGSYERNYSSYGTKTFCPFIWKGKEYALYSRDYTSTRVMTLPDCKDLCGEERDGYGFCPVEYYVPMNPFTGESAGFGFLAGCVWGDDTSWKIQFLDLRQVDEGILIRDDRFGYLELPGKVRHLRDAIRCRAVDSNFTISSYVGITAEREWYVWNAKDEDADE